MLIQLYVAEPGMRKVPTVHGPIRYHDWLMAEKARIDRSGRECVIESHQQFKPDGVTYNGTHYSLYCEPYCSVKDCRKLAVKVKRHNRQQYFFCDTCNIADYNGNSRDARRKKERRRIKWI